MRIANYHYVKYFTITIFSSHCYVMMMSLIIIKIMPVYNPRTHHNYAVGKHYGAGQCYIMMMSLIMTIP